ncbi:hypothetical protein NC651_038871 [Populus alba x Populus x berolinensis]|nr:hypothetical protein NC651_038871 [Populus alba x Populus x berolinensis]
MRRRKTMVGNLRNSSQLPHAGPLPFFSTLQLLFFLSATLSTP